MHNQYFFLSYDGGGGGKYADIIGLSILFCLQQKKYIKEPNLISCKMFDSLVAENLYMKNALIGFYNKTSL